MNFAFLSGLVASDGSSDITSPHSPSTRSHDLCDADIADAPDDAGILALAAACRLLARDDPARADELLVQWPRRRSHYALWLTTRLHVLANAGDAALLANLPEIVEGAVSAMEQVLLRASHRKGVAAVAVAVAGPATAAASGRGLESGLAQAIGLWQALCKAMARAELTCSVADTLPCGLRAAVRFLDSPAFPHIALADPAARSRPLLELADALLADVGPVPADLARLVMRKLAQRAFSTSRPPGLAGDAMTSSTPSRLSLCALILHCADLSDAALLDASVRCTVDACVDACIAHGRGDWAAQVWSGVAAGANGNFSIAADPDDAAGRRRCRAMSPWLSRRLREAAHLDDELDTLQALAALAARPVAGLPGLPRTGEPAHRPLMLLTHLLRVRLSLHEADASPATRARARRLLEAIDAEQRRADAAAGSLSARQLAVVIAWRDEILQILGPLAQRTVSDPALAAC